MIINDYQAFLVFLTQSSKIQKYIDQKIQPLDNMSVLVANLKDQLLREVLLFASYTKPRPNLSQRLVLINEVSYTLRNNCYLGGYPSIAMIDYTISGAHEKKNVGRSVQLPRI